MDKYLYRNEFIWKLKTKFLGTSMMVSFDVYPRLLTYFMILVPALQGISLRAEYLYPCIPLIYRFVEVVIHRTVLYQMFNIAETSVILNRLQVLCASVLGSCLSHIHHFKSNSYILTHIIEMFVQYQYIYHPLKCQTYHIYL